MDSAAVVAGCLIFILVVFLPPVLNDGDTLWQIRTGDWILDHLAVPAIDPFSFTAGDRHWFAHEWFAETLMALAFRVCGMQGIMLLTAAATGLTAAILLHGARQFLPGIYASAGLIIALSNAAPSMLARPHLLAWPCLALWCSGLVTARAKRVVPSFMLLPAMLLWVNLHGSFMVGLLLPGAFMIEALMDPGIDRRQVLTGWAGFILAAWAVALLNPDFLAGVLFPIHMIGMKSLAWIGEWAPADLTGLKPLELTILAFLVLGLSGQVRLPPIRLLLLLGLIHGALSHARNGQLLGIVGLLILMEPLGQSLARGRAGTLAIAWPRVAASAALVAVAIRLALPMTPERTGVDFTVTLDSVPPELRAQPVLNEYGLGGELIFNGVRPFVDSRADLYGDAFLDRYRQIVASNPTELAAALSTYEIAWTIFPANHPIIQTLDQMPGWRRLTARNGIVVNVRQDRLSPLARNAPSLNRAH